MLLQQQAPVSSPPPAAGVRPAPQSRAGVLLPRARFRLLRKRNPRLLLEGPAGVSPPAARLRVPPGSSHRPGILRPGFELRLLPPRPPGVLPEPQPRLPGSPVPVRLPRRLLEVGRSELLLARPQLQLLRVRPSPMLLRRPPELPPPAAAVRLQPPRFPDVRSAVLQRPPGLLLLRARPARMLLRRPSELPPGEPTGLPATSAAAPQQQQQQQRQQPPPDRRPRPGLLPIRPQLRLLRVRTTQMLLPRQQQPPVSDPATVLRLRPASVPHQQEQQQQQQQQQQERLHLRSHLRSQQPRQPQRTRLLKKKRDGRSDRPTATTTTMRFRTTDRIEPRSVCASRVRRIRIRIRRKIFGVRCPFREKPAVIRVPTYLPVGRSVSQSVGYVSWLDLFLCQLVGRSVGIGSLLFVGVRELEGTRTKRNERNRFTPLLVLVLLL
mmetsp:Transcript_21496/g.51282  ORF Transcript_21496/g.51282 Transcript_21496/m.51282 type:complete len:437 (-) Transcript_21496:42-1352(-)